MAVAPVNTPVLSLARSVRSRSLLRARLLADRRRTAARCAGVVSSSTSGCSGDSTMYVAPYSVSGRVVKTRISRPATGVALCEHHLGAFAAADPVALHGHRRFGPVELVQIRQQAVGVAR